MIYNIPAHKKCENCGGCCGVIATTQHNYSEIVHSIVPRLKVVLKDKMVQLCNELDIPRGTLDNQIHGSEPSVMGCVELIMILDYLDMTLEDFLKVNPRKEGQTK